MMTLKAFLVQQRSLLSALLKDRARYRSALLGRGAEYLSLCNRNERLEAAPDGNGYRCDWRWTSDLHAPKFLPKLGANLLRRALADHPVRRYAEPVTSSAPEISFVIGHRGMERLPHLLATLESIAGQRGASVECVVVEQDIVPQIAHQLPSWVIHIHTPPPAADMPYCRSWTFNVGAKHCRSDVVVLHDNDMLVSEDYAAGILDRIRVGYEAVNLKRFVFYLDQQHTKAVFSRRENLDRYAPQAIVQNLEAGGSVAITRDAFDRIGGMDESFIGWGGEDNEFWERAQTLRVWPYAYLPIVHLWHPAQPGKLEVQKPTEHLYTRLSSVDPLVRISQLRKVVAGELSGPTGWRCKSND